MLERKRIKRRHAHPIRFKTLMIVYVLMSSSSQWLCNACSGTFQLLPSDCCPSWSEQNIVDSTECDFNFYAFKKYLANIKC